MDFNKKDTVQYNHSNTITAQLMIPSRSAIKLAGYHLWSNWQSHFKREGLRFFYYYYYFFYIHFFLQNLKLHLSFLSNFPWIYLKILSFSRIYLTSFFWIYILRLTSFSRILRTRSTTSTSSLSWIQSVRS